VSGRRPRDWVIQDALAQAIRAQEALADGDTVLVEQTLAGLVRDLEDDLLPRRKLRCPTCGLNFRWPGELADHSYHVHGQVLKRSRAA
jgi:uncharacterized C2H2 Zn-finger protein